MSSTGSKETAVVNRSDGAQSSGVALEHMNALPLLLGFPHACHIVIEAAGHQFLAVCFQKCNTADSVE